MYNNIMLNIKETLDNFKIYTYSQANKILLNNINNSGDQGTLYIVAGPNGSGKSTLIANFYAQNMLKNVKYINADIIAQLYLLDNPNSNNIDYLAMHKTMRLVEDTATTHQSIVYETVLSHESKLEIVKLYKQNNYKVISIFISPSDSQINLQRVGIRVSEGGHNVPEDKIVSRFERSHLLKKQLQKLSDEYYEIDNSTYPTLIQYIKN